MLRQYLRLTLLLLLVVMVMVVHTVVQVDAVAGRGRQCLVRVVVPVGSCWQRLGESARRMSLSRLLWLARQHNLKLRQGRPPPHSPRPHILVTNCHTRRRMWATLPQQGGFPHALEDDNSSACILERLTEILLGFFGALPLSPEQKDGAPPRVYMLNYCGKDLPVKRKPVGGKRMYNETLRLEKELLALP